MNRVTKKVGKYEIGRTLGEGTFAKVKFAKITETGEAVAVKVLNPAAISEPSCHVGKYEIGRTQLPFLNHNRRYPKQSP